MKGRWQFVLAALVILFGPPFLVIRGLQALAWLLYLVFPSSFPAWFARFYMKGYAVTVLAAHTLASAALMALLTRRRKPAERGQSILTAVAVPLAMPFLAFWPLSRLRWLLYRWLPHITSRPWWLFPIDAYPFLSARLLSDMTRYLVLSLAALGLTGAALIWLAVRERRRVWQRGRFFVLLAALVSVLAFPLLMRYEPAVKAAPDVEMYLVEKPGLLTGAVRRCQTVAEVRRCQYEPLGWADAQTLVYRRWCDGHHTEEGWKPGEPQPPQAYHLDTREVSSFDGYMAHLSREMCKPAMCVSPALAEKEYFAPLYYLPGHFDDAFISPDGRWIAFTAEHVYGPEDLLVISEGG